MHYGDRDTRARTSAKALWFGAGVKARRQDVSRTFDAMQDFIGSTKAHPSQQTAYLNAPDQAGQTHLDRALITLQSLRNKPGEFTLDSPSRKTVTLAELVAMAYNLVDGVHENITEQTQGRRLELKRHIVAALSGSLADQGGETFCAQGIVRRVLTPLQGYYPEVQIDDVLKPASESKFVLDFGVELAQIIKTQAAGTDIKELVQQETARAVARARTLYAPKPDWRGHISDAARQTASARVDEVERQIAKYLYLNDLI